MARDVTAEVFDHGTVVAHRDPDRPLDLAKLGTAVARRRGRSGSIELLHAGTGAACALLDRVERDAPGIVGLSHIAPSPISRPAPYRAQPPGCVH